MVSATDIPILVPPRTPTPPSDDDHQVGLGLNGPLLVELSQDPDALSPLSATFPQSISAPAAGASTSSRGQLTPRTPTRYNFMDSTSGDGSASAGNSPELARNPFNFQPQQYVVGGKSPPKSVSEGSQFFAHARGANSTPGPWKTSRTQVQAQQRFPSDIP